MISQEKLLQLDLYITYYGQAITLGAPALLPLPPESLEPYDNLLPCLRITPVSCVPGLLSDCVSASRPLMYHKDHECLIIVSNQQLKKKKSTMLSISFCYLGF